MVRCGTLPLRLFALESGAHLAYGEELVSMRFEKAARVSNERLGSADVVGHDGRVLFRTLERERGRCIFQLGTGDGASALRAAELVARDVAAVDLNMGCPKKFSTSGGMGAALLREPDKAAGGRTFGAAVARELAGDYAEELAGWASGAAGAATLLRLLAGHGEGQVPGSRARTILRCIMRYSSLSMISSSALKLAAVHSWSSACFTFGCCMSFTRWLTLSSV